MEYKGYNGVSNDFNFSLRQRKDERKEKEEQGGAQIGGSKYIHREGGREGGKQGGREGGRDGGREGRRSRGWPHCTR